MDPLNRVLWWREHDPAIYGRADRFLGWHELMTERLCGRAVIDRSLAGKFFGYDLARASWSAARLEAFEIEPRLLPAIEDWGTAVGTVGTAVANELGLPAGVVVGVGALDTSCAAVGTGACRPGVAGLAVGSWESFVVPVAAPPPAPAIAAATLSLGPHPGGTGLGVWSLSPNGTVVVERIRSLLGLSLAELGAELERCGPGPSPVIAVPHLSGATSPWRDGDRSEGAVVGMSLATTRADLVRAFLEGIALDLALTMERLRDAGAAAAAFRVTGGGAQSAWWMQLKADLTGIPVEVVAEPEAGALGAAILAGVADGTYPSIEAAVDAIDVPVRRYEPDAGRGALFARRRDEYATLVEALLPHSAQRER
jgi:xylulokinase